MLIRRVLLVLSLATSGLCLGISEVKADPGEAVATSSDYSTKLAVGGKHACAIENAKIYCWGDNTRYQLGSTQGYPSSSTPIEVEGIDNAVAVTAGFEHTCALLSDKTVKCWGSNQSKQLGRTGSTSATPSIVAGLSGVIALTAGNDFNCALLESSHGVKCWGYNTAYGPQLGRVSAGGNVITSDNPADPTPDFVVGLESGVSRIVSGSSHSCGILQDETVKCWGGNFSGQLGNGSNSGTTMSSPGAVAVIGISGAKSIAPGDQHTCASFADGSAKCWGSFFEGELGSGTNDANEVDNHGLSPNSVVASGGSTSPLTGVTSISAGSSFTCAVRATKAATCWGTNALSQLGAGSGSGYVPAPVAVQSISDVAFVSTGMSSACAISYSRVVWCWGAGSNGQIGNGASENAPSPAAVKGVITQSISFNALADKAMGDAAFSVSATSSSGGSVRFESTTPTVCTVSGSIVTLVAPGTCTISASRGEYGLYKAATAVAQSFKVGGLKPTAKTGTASPQSTKATLRGTVNAGGADTTINFVYGTDPKLATGTTTVKTSNRSTTVDEEILATISDLKESTTYYYRIDATNTVGTASGSIVSFVTHGPEGVSINDGDEFTNTISVTVSVVGPSNATKVLVSNDGGFKGATTFNLTDSAADIPWTLQASRDGTFSKTVYVRFLSRFDAKVTDDKTDDIILDTSKPVLNAVQASAMSGGGEVTVASLRAKAADAAKISLQATDTISGAVAIEIRSAASKPSTTVKLSKAPSKVKTMGQPRKTVASVSVKTTAKKLQVRAVDGAGNTSAWKVVTVK